MERTEFKAMLFGAGAFTVLHTISEKVSGGPGVHRCSTGSDPETQTEDSTQTGLTIKMHPFPEGPVRNRGSPMIFR